jgi:hypothetical protein
MEALIVIRVEYPAGVVRLTDCASTSTLPSNTLIDISPTGWACNTRVLLALIVTPFTVKTAVCPLGICTIMPDGGS